MNNKQIILHLSLIDGIGPVTVKKLLENKPDDIPLSDLHRFSISDFGNYFGLTRIVSQKLSAGLSDNKVLEKELALLEKYGARFTVLGDRDYPELLSHIHAPPPVLYWCGEPVFKEPKTIAVIGSRCAHRYAEQIIQQFVPALVNEGWVIVSGGALGADSMAHRETVKFHGKTVVVLGSGLLHPYPATNKNLFDDVLDHGGAMVSSFPLSTTARPGNFPARNRIIAGLSRGCVVVQAAQRSGARITAQFALEQGREVFAVPGPIGDELSMGCHRLIQAGAKLVCCSEDIFAEFDLNRGLAPKVAKNTIRLNPSKEKILRPIANENNKVASDKTPQGQLVFACSTPTATDDLAAKFGFSVDEVQELLFDLQLEGRIQQNFAGLWERA